MEKVDNKRTYHFVEDIKPESIKKLMEWVGERLQEDSESWLQLTVTSFGGLVDPGFGFLDLITGIRKTRLQTVALGNAASMAVILFLAGEHRVITPRATLFLHELGRTLEKETRYSTTDVEKILVHLKYQQKLYAEFVAERSGKRLSVERVLGMMKEETRITPTMAVEFGLAHEISE